MYGQGMEGVGFNKMIGDPYKICDVRTPVERQYMSATAVSKPFWETLHGTP